MVFSNLFFLYCFLPAVLFLYFIASPLFRNSILLVASLFFYAWGEPRYLILMVFSILINYGYGIWIEKSHPKEKKKKLIVATAIIINLALLGYFKYAHFFIDVIDKMFHLHFQMKPLSLPIGISFYTFHALSYLIDVYRKKEKAQRNLFNLALYIANFSQLVAGPIIRYNDVAEQIKARMVTSNQFVDGIQRFILGLAKKVIVANPLGSIADKIFALQGTDLSTATAWIGILAYTMQIYFDFSGYSDMAIGLGKMFGFEFRENFNYPYISQSVSEFWRRWHISLGNWFRDYLYISLGGNRVSPWKVYRNLLIVWTATGFWHGASWTFMLWGFYYAVIICLERAFLGKWLEWLWKPIRHVYVMFLVMVGWVFFRADNWHYSLSYLKAMFGFNQIHIDANFYYYLLNDGDAEYLILGLLFIVPLFPAVKSFIAEKATHNPVISFLRDWVGIIMYLGLLMLVTMYLVNSTYNPFIYFRF